MSQSSNVTNTLTPIAYTSYTALSEIKFTDVINDESVKTTPYNEPSFSSIGIGVSSKIGMKNGKNISVPTYNVSFSDEDNNYGTIVDNKIINYTQQENEAFTAYEYEKRLYSNNLLINMFYDSTSEIDTSKTFSLSSPQNDYQEYYNSLFQRYIVTTDVINRKLGDIADLVKQYPNIYIEISNLSQFNKNYKRILLDNLLPCNSESETFYSKFIKLINDNKVYNKSFDITDIVPVYNSCIMNNLKQIIDIIVLKGSTAQKQHITNSILKFITENSNYNLTSDDLKYHNIFITDYASNSSNDISINSIVTQYIYIENGTPKYISGDKKIELIPKKYTTTIKDYLYCTTNYVVTLTKTYKDFVDGVAQLYPEFNSSIHSIEKINKMFDNAIIINAPAIFNKIEEIKTYNPLEINNN